MSERDPLHRLVALLSRLPGIGEKSALRLALAIARSEGGYASALSSAIQSVHDELKWCAICFDLCADTICERCRDPRRDQSVVCVVAQPQDRIAFERAGVYRGLYHVLHGVLDPLGGIGPNELKIDGLLQRVQSTHAELLGEGEEGPSLREVIVATSPNVEGDATALYLSKLLSPLGITVSRIASGVAVGGELEYADMTTLHRALEDRRSL